MPVLKNVEVRWASIHEPNTKFDPKWEVQAMLTEQQAAELTDKGLKVKKDDEGRLFHRFSRKTHGIRKDGRKFEKEAPRCVDGTKAPFTELVGNGSICNIQYGVGDYGSFGIASDLMALQVLKHVPYSGGAGDEFEDEGATEVVAGSSIADDEEDGPF